MAKGQKSVPYHERMRKMTRDQKKHMIDYNTQYVKENYKPIMFRLSFANEDDAIERIEYMRAAGVNTHDYILKLIREDIRVARLAGYKGFEEMDDADKVGEH